MIQCDLNGFQHLKQSLFIFQMKIYLTWLITQKKHLNYTQYSMSCSIILSIAKLAFHYTIPNKLKYHLTNGVNVRRQVQLKLIFFIWIFLVQPQQRIKVSWNTIQQFLFVFLWLSHNISELIQYFSHTSFKILLVFHIKKHISPQ